MAAPRGELNLVLHYAGGPQQAHYIGLRLLAQADQQVRGALSRRTAIGDFPLLIELAGEDFDLRAHGALVVIQSPEGKAQRVVLIPAGVAQQKRGAIHLGDGDIGVTITVEVGGSEHEWRLQRQLVQADLGGNVAKSRRALVAQQAKLRPVGGVLAGGDDIQPAIVVVVENGDGPCPTSRGHSRRRRARSFHSCCATARAAPPPGR